MKSIRVVCLLLIATLCCTLSSLAEQLGYSPQIAGLALGKGVAGVDYKTPRDACVSAPKTNVPKSASSMRVSIVYDASQLSQSLHIDSKADASFLDIASASGHFNLAEEFNDSNRAFDVVIEAWQETDNDTFVTSPDWLPKYQSKITAGQFSQVRQDCGDRYVSTVYNAARLFAIVRVETSARDFHLNVSTGGQAKFNIDIVNANASLGVDSDIKTAHQHGAIGVIAISEGLGGFQDLANIISIANGDGLNDIANKTQAALKDIHVKGQAVAYELTPYPGLAPRSLTDDNIDYHLAQLRYAYRVRQGLLSNVDCLLNSCDGRAQLLKLPDVAQLKAYKAKLETAATTVASRFQKCAVSYAVADPACNAIIPDLPSPPAVDATYWNLPPVWGGMLVVLNNGRILSADEGKAVFDRAIHSPSLLDAAKTLYPDATSVDVLGIVQSPYFSVMSIIPLQLGDKLTIPPVSTGVLFGRKTLPFDPAWHLPPAMKKTGFYVPLLHASAYDTCQLKIGKDVVFGSTLIGFDSSCVSSKAKQLFGAVRTAAITGAHAGCFSSPPTFTQTATLDASMANLFGVTSQTTVGNFFVAYARQPNGNCKVDSSLRIENAFHSYVLGVYFETEEITP